MVPHLREFLHAGRVKTNGRMSVSVSNYLRTVRMDAWMMYCDFMGFFIFFVVVVMLIYFMFLIIMYNLISLCIFLLSSRKQNYYRKHNYSRKHKYVLYCGPRHRYY